MFAPKLKTVAISLTAGVLVYAAMLGLMRGAGGMAFCGMGMSSHKPAPPVLPARTLKISMTMLSAPKTGDNSLDIVIKNAAGKPVTAAKITADVAMTSMDMGTDHPAVNETGMGHYTSNASFSMAGPWRVTIYVSSPGQKVEAKSFDFTAE